MKQLLRSVGAGLPATFATGPMGRQQAGSYARLGFLLFLAPLFAWAQDPAGAISYKTQIQPVLNAQCVFCHVTGAENGGLNLGRRESHASLMAPSTEATMPRVTPGDPGKSYLVHKLKGTQLEAGGSGNSMPMYDPPRPFDPALLALIVKWIESGAPNN